MFMYVYPLKINACDTPLCLSFQMFVSLKMSPAETEIT